MGNSALQGWDAFVLTVPFLGFLGMVMFGLDERWAAPKRKRRHPRLFCQADGAGFTDPDGRPCRKPTFIPFKSELIPTGGPGWDRSEAKVQHSSAATMVIDGYVIGK